MAVLDTRVPIIGIDGNHRTGKGTQLDILHHKLLGDGYKPLILRGDEATSTSPETPEVFWANINNLSLDECTPALKDYVTRRQA